MKPLKLNTLVAVSALLSTFFAWSVSAASLNSVLQVGEAKTRAAQASQKRIDKIADDADNLLSQYKTVTKEVEGLKIYNQRLDIQIQSQKNRLLEMDDEMTQATVIQRQITPLVIRMIDGLEQFVGLDKPFLKDERLSRVNFLRTNVDRSDLSPAEKFRQVMEAYKIENEYGRKIETYSDEIELDGGARKVDILRVGRIALLFQTTDKEVTGTWADGTWQVLDSGEYRNAVSQGIRIAKKQASIDIMNLPIAAPEAVQ